MRKEDKEEGGKVALLKARTHQLSNTRKLTEYRSLSHEKGQFVDGQGVYIGIWEPRDDKGERSLGAIFDVYAAPSCLLTYDEVPARGIFNDMIRYVAALRKWHGHDGTYIKGSYAIEVAIREGREEILKKWFVPPIELLNGRDRHDHELLVDNMLGFQETSFSGEGREVVLRDNGHEKRGDLFASCTFITPGEPLGDRSYVICVDPKIGLNEHAAQWYKDAVSIHPVRAVLKGRYDPSQRNALKLG